MSHLPEHVIRTLWYIDTMEQQRFQLQLADVDVFARTRVPRDIDRTIYGFLDSGLVTRSPEAVGLYMRKVGWIHLDNESYVSITPLGKAVLAACGEEADVEGSGSEVSDVTLDPTDPLVYVHLTRRLSRAGAGLLIDPYFKAESLPFLVDSTSLRRVLISGSSKTKKDRDAMAVALATVPNASDVEVRHIEDPAMHDRCVIGQDNRVQLLGSSLNGVGKHHTAVISPQPDIAETYRKKYEALWSKAAVLAPQAMKGSTAPTP
ncbi:hypothetical protein [Kitasatospora sp. NPDC004289]